MKRRYCSIALSLILVAATVVIAVAAILLTPQSAPLGIIGLKWAGPGGEIELPSAIGISGGEAVMETVLPDELGDDLYIYIKTNYCPLRVTVNGLEAAQDCLRNSWPQASFELPWTRVRLSADMAGARVSVSLLPGGSKIKREAYETLLGTENAVRLLLLARSLPVMIVFVTALLLCVILLTLSWRTVKLQTQPDAGRYSYLAVFIALVNAWMLTDSDLQGAYFIGNSFYFVYNLFSYMLIPIPFVMFIASMARAGRRWLLAEVCVMALIVASSGLILGLGRLRLSFVLTTTHVLVTAAIASAIFVCLYGYFRKKGSIPLSVLFGTTLLGVGGAIAIADFYIGVSPSNTRFFIYGVGSFVTIMSIEGVRSGVGLLSMAQSYEKLSISEEEYRIAARHSSKHIMRYDVRTGTLRQQIETARLFGLDTVVENVPASIVSAGVIDDESVADFNAFFANMRKGVRDGSMVGRFRLIGGRLIWVHADYTLIFSDRGAPLQSVISFYDVSALREKEIAYEKWLQSHRELPLESINYYEGNLTKDIFDREEGSLLPALPSAVRRSLSEMAEYIARNHTCDADRAKFLAFYDRARLLKRYEDGVRTDKLEYLRIGPHGEPRWTLASAQLIADPYAGDIKCFVLLKDIDEQKKAELVERNRSYHDPLTGLLNRAALIERVGNTLRIMREDRHAFVMLDVDGFKGVNDAYGHKFGDSVLVDIGDELRAMTRGEDMLCRMGGDEFAIFLCQIPHENAFLERRCEYICQVLAKQFGSNIAISASLGIAIYPDDGKSFDELYERADKALYYVKQHGKSNYAFYSDDIADRPAEGRPKAAALPGKPYGDKAEETVRTLLIVDDVEMNREILRLVLEEEYNIVMAGSGEEALFVLERGANSVSAVLLDLMMPGMSGLDVLERMRGDAYLSTLPVIAVSAADEKDYSSRVIELGAADFITKPIDPDLVKLRVKNAIQRCENDELRAQNRYLLMLKSDESRHQNQLRYIAEHDGLTNICNKAAFYKKTEAMLRADPDTTYVMIAFDIEKFRVINDIFGHEEGDRLLRYIATRLRVIGGKSSTYARIDADNFTICLPYDRERLLEIYAQGISDIKDYGLSFDIVLCSGLYVIDDRSLPVSIMHDRAVLAKRTVKGNYVKRYAYYDEELRNELLEEQEIVSRMNMALEGEQFKVVLQPKCRLGSGEIIGAEALVRWEHPQRGLLLPGAFIPIFEKNGFIMRLDAYVWERVCMLLRRWLDEKKPGLPLPVSTNISRVNLYNPNLCSTLKKLVSQYDIPPRLLELEITESAYADNPKLMLSVTQELRANGFTVEMDDFGSGYSSLNMLKDVPVDVLKIDMRFLYGRDETGRGGSILTSVIRMARWLGLPVVAEGVETPEQADYLYSIGCGSAQGYYFHKPMDVTAFEEIISAVPKKPEGAERTAPVSPANNLWGIDSEFSFVLDSVIGSAGLYEMSGDNIEAVRCNKEYFDLLGETPEDFFSKGTDVMRLVSPEDRQGFLSAFKDALSSGSTREYEYGRLREGGGVTRMRIRIRCVSGDESRSLFFVTFGMPT